MTKYQMPHVLNPEKAALKSSQLLLNFRGILPLRIIGSFLPLIHCFSPQSMQMVIVQRGLLRYFLCSRLQIGTSDFMVLEETIRQGKKFSLKPLLELQVSDSSVASI